MPKKIMKNVVVIGGGTGTSTVISGLIHYPIQITALISVADSGGSTGRLRDEFGFQPVGDLRQSLAALAAEDSDGWIRKLLLYRFEKGDGLRGHNLGNLILTALQDMAGSTSNAMEVAEKIFRLEGNVYPVTTEKVDLAIEYEHGKVVVGEKTLNSNKMAGIKIKKIRLVPSAAMYKKAREAVQSVDVIVIGPGDHYASVLAALCVTGMKNAMKKSIAKIVYVLNLMTRYNQTHGMSAEDHIQEVEQMIGRRCNAILINNGNISRDMLRLYAAEHEFPVEVKKKDSRYIFRDFVHVAEDKQSSADALHRSLLRHNPDVLAKALMEIV